MKRYDNPPILAHKHDCLDSGANYNANFLITRFSYERKNVKSE